MDHAGSGQVLPIIVMDLDINPTEPSKKHLWIMIGSFNARTVVEFERNKM